MNRTLAIGLAALVTAATVYIGFGAYQALTRPPARAIEKTTFTLDWKTGAQHAFAYLAQEKGFYREAGLDVTIQDGNGSPNVAKTLASGSTDYAYLDALTMLQTVGQGACIQALAVGYQDTPFSLFWVEPTTSIRTLADLKDKRIGAVPTSGSTTIGLSYALRQVGRTLKDGYITLQPGDVAPLMAGQIDVMPGFFNSDPVTLDVRLGQEGKGRRAGVLKLADVGLKAYSLSITTSCENLKARPDQAKRFAQASLRGWQYAIEHPEEAVDLILARRPELASNEGRTVQRATIKTTSELVLAGSARQWGIGWQDWAGWTQTLKSLNEFGPMEKPIALDVAQVYTALALPGPKVNR